MPRPSRLCCLVLASLLSAADGAAPALAQDSPYRRWDLGPDRDPGFFPLGVWLQDPRRAPDWQAAGINLYVGLWQGPTEAQLAELRRHRMPVICAQNAVGLAHRDDPTIVGWMHDDEPDNAHAFAGFWGGDIARIQAAWPEEASFRQYGPDRPFREHWGPPIPPSWIVRDAEAMRGRDPRRPIFLNLGQGVVWTGWKGRGTRTGRREDYPVYVQGADIVSFDIYPGATADPEVQGRLWLVADGVTALRGWAGDRAVAWNCIEAGFGDARHTATPRQVRAEVWQSIIHGSRGIIYFVHRFGAQVNDHALLDDPALLAEVARTNRRIRTLAPVLNRPSVPTAATAASDDPAVPVALMAKADAGTVHLFAAAMRPGPTRVAFTVAGVDAGTATVLDEGRSLPIVGGRFSDVFDDWAVHLYEIRR